MTNSKGGKIGYVRTLNDSDLLVVRTGGGGGYGQAHK